MSCNALCHLTLWPTYFLYSNHTGLFSVPEILQSLPCLNFFAYAILSAQNVLYLFFAWLNLSSIRCQFKHYLRWVCTDTVSSPFFFFLDDLIFLLLIYLVSYSFSAIYKLHVGKHTFCLTHFCLKPLAQCLVYSEQNKYFQISIYLVNEWVLF